MANELVRLRLHEPTTSLLLIHEVEQPSYLLLEEIMVLDITFCGAVVSSLLVSGSVAASQDTQLAGTSCGLICSEMVESSPALNLAAESTPRIHATVSGGIC